MARHGNAGHCNAGNLPAHAALPCTTRLADERHPLRNGVPYLACILAETRSGPSYIASAPTPQALDGVGRRLRERNSVRGHRQAPVAILAVRYEECENEAAALLRAAEISWLSHCRQRRLIESFNPQWQDLSGMSIGFPLIVTLPERKGLGYHLMTDL